MTKRELRMIYVARLAYDLLHNGLENPGMQRQRIDGTTFAMSQMTNARTDYAREMFLSLGVDIDQSHAINGLTDTQLLEWLSAPSRRARQDAAQARAREERRAARADTARNVARRPGGRMAVRAVPSVEVRVNRALESWAEEEAAATPPTRPAPGILPGVGSVANRLRELGNLADAVAMSRHTSMSAPEETEEEREARIGHLRDLITPPRSVEDSDPDEVDDPAFGYPADFQMPVDEDGMPMLRMNRRGEFVPVSTKTRKVKDKKTGHLLPAPPTQKKKPSRRLIVGRKRPPVAPDE